MTEIPDVLLQLIQTVPLLKQARFLLTDAVGVLQSLGYNSTANELGELINALQLNSHTLFTITEELQEQYGEQF